MGTFQDASLLFLFGGYVSFLEGKCLGSWKSSSSKIHASFIHCTLKNSATFGNMSKQHYGFEQIFHSRYDQNKALEPRWDSFLCKHVVKRQGFAPGSNPAFWRTDHPWVFLGPVAPLKSCAFFKLDPFPQVEFIQKSLKPQTSSLSVQQKWHSPYEQKQLVTIDSGKVRYWIDA